MTASKSTMPTEPKIKTEPVVKPKKHVTIKLEPQHINNSNKGTPTISTPYNSNKVSITPNEKIVKQPNLKSIDHNLNISKFYIQPHEDEQDETPTKSMSSKAKLNLSELQKNHLKQAGSSKNEAPHPKPKRPINEAATKSTVVTAPKRPKHIKKPESFKPIEESLLLNTDDLNLGQIFNNIDDEVVKQKYIESGSRKFDDWCSQGFTLINGQYQIVQKIIISRNKLNLKFKSIFGLINKYGVELENEDEVLKEKMDKLQKLGEEIKKFIS